MSGRTARFLLRRLVQAVFTVLAVAVLDFGLLKLAPGDAADVLAGEAGVGDAEYVGQLRAQFGLDRPVWSQLLAFLWRLAHLDLGWSFRAGRPVAALIFERLPATLLLMGTALVVAVLVGTALGALSARHAGRWPDDLIGFVTLLFHATPLFWTGLMLVVLFSVTLGWVPTGGMRDPVNAHAGLAAAGDILRHLLLPAGTLSLFFLAPYTRLVRASMLEVGGMDWVRTAHAKGLTEAHVLLWHVLRNALVPLVTMVGLQAASLLGGSVLIETVFSWPGLGRLMFEAVFQRDLNVLLSILVLSAVLVVAVNLVVDLLYAALNPALEAG